MNNGLNTGFGSSRPKPVPGRLVLLPRFDARNLPARAAWLGKVTTNSSDLLIQKSLPSAATWSAVGFGAATGRIVAISASGSSAFSDDDGLTWTAGGALPTGTGWNFIAYGAGLFVAINNDATNNACASSPDGVTWTSRTLAAGAYVGVVYGTKFIAAVGSGATKTSSDGITWGSGGSAGTAATGITYLSGAGLYIVTGTTGGSYPQTSPDGTTWTNRAANIQGVTASLIAASPNRAITLLAAAAGNWVSAQSPDGINWITQGMPAISTSASSAALTYGNGLFFMAANAGLMASIDGVNWRPATPFGTGSTNSALNPVLSATTTNAMTVGKSRVVILPVSSSQQSVYVTDSNAQDLFYVP